MIEIPISPQSSPTVSSVCAFLSCATHPPIAQKMHFPQFAPNFGKFLSQIINAPHLHQTSYDRFSFTSHMYSSTSFYQISLLIPNMYVYQSQICLAIPNNHHGTSIFPDLSFRRYKISAQHIFPNVFTNAIYASNLSINFIKKSYI